MWHDKNEGIERRFAMGKILGVYLMPHPPIIVYEVGGESRRGAQRTIDSMEALSKEIEGKRPDTIIVISPHGPIFSDGIGIMSETILEGNFSRFGASKLSMSFYSDDALIERIYYEAQKVGVLALGLDKTMCLSYNISPSLDWGVLVPLHFINQRYTKYKLIAMGSSQLPLHELYAFGIAMKRAVEAHNGNVVVIASGDLSHRLKEEGPYGYHPAGEELDKTITSLLSQGDVEGLFTIDPALIEEGAECGLRSLIMAMGVLDGQAFNSRVLSYEGPFGVGYCVAAFEPGVTETSRLLMDKLIGNNKRLIEKLRENESEYVRLARTALELYIHKGTIASIDDNLPSSMLENRAGVFVTIKQNGQLRGCIGTIEPTKRNIAEEIVHNAISAGTRDPRFFPVKREELDNLVYSVDVLKEPEPIESIEELDVKRYGVIVSSLDSRNGLLLPNLDGIKTPKEQVSIALEKAGIGENEPYTMKRFEVIRYQ